MSSERHFPGYVPNPHYTQEDWDEVCDHPELTDEELAQMKPLAVVMPGLVEAIRRSRGDPEPTRDWVWVNMDRDLLAALRGTGPGWQDRLNAVLREAASRGALDARPPEAASRRHRLAPRTRKVYVACRIDDLRYGPVDR